MWFDSCYVWLQGTRVWLQEQDRLQPCTVGPRTDGAMLFTTDYGEVSEMKAKDVHDEVKKTFLND